MKTGRATLAASVVLAFIAQDARAGGFEIPGFGSRGMGRGAAFAVLADDLSALLINPGGLSRQKGTTLQLNHNLIWHHAEFTRVATLMNDDFDAASRPADPLATVENGKTLFPLGAMLGLASDFGLEDWVFALHISGPNAVGVVDYPTHGGQRYMLTSMEMLLIYYTAAAAWGKEDTFGIGVALSYAHLPVSNFGLIVDGGGGEPKPYFSNFDLDSTLELADQTGFTATVGGWWRVIPQLEVALAARIVPVYLNPEGTVELTVPQGQSFPGEIELRGGTAALEITLPIVVRTGLRYRHLGKGDREIFDIELDFVYEAWSSIESYDIDLEGDAIVTLETGGEKSEVTTPLSDLKIEKRWRDTYSVRLGGTWNAVEDLFSLSLGGFWESGAVPNNYSNLDFTSFDRYGVGGGIRFTFYGIDLNVAYLHVFQEERDVTEEFGKVFQARPLSPCPSNCSGLDGVPANAGHFKTSYDMLNMSLTLHFDQWGSKSKDETKKKD